jgi:hypothetical protein
MEAGKVLRSLTSPRSPPDSHHCSLAVELRPPPPSTPRARRPAAPRDSHRCNLHPPRDLRRRELHHWHRPRCRYPARAECAGRSSTATTGREVRRPRELRTARQEAAQPLLPWLLHRPGASGRWWMEGGKGRERGGVVGNWGWGCVGGVKKEGERLTIGSHHVLVGIYRGEK